MNARHRVDRRCPLMQAGAQALSVVDEGGEVVRVGFVVRRR